MAEETPKPGETKKPEAPSNDGNNAGTQNNPGNASDKADAERLRKEHEQAQMRIRQLEKEADARKKADEEREAKELEENNKYKELYEQETGKRKQLESEKELEEQKAELNKAKTDTLKEYSDEVKTAAEELGIELSSTDTTDVDAYKAKLDKLKEREEKNQQVGPNNGRPRNTNLSKQELLAEAAKGGKAAQSELIGNIPWVKNHGN